MGNIPSKVILNGGEALTAVMPALLLYQTKKCNLKLTRITARSATSVHPAKRCYISSCSIE
ncbi:hypothetical protein DPMN_007046 [Dreissena polymorpha]|uniref:Uncharacterized protein n=1 Tax=Dreissena polymorpha TaxID=45954 RepID=A0A9D4RVL0_DREPO|nr:hypothetical protein DPMN_007046 [Dreissena polymorpha]